MKLASLLHRVAALAARRPVLVLALTALLAIAGGALALRLEPDAGTDTLVGRDTDTYEATEAFRERFGDDAIFILVEQDLRRLVLTEDLQRLLGLEGCISGNAPAGAQIPGGRDGPCGRLAATKPVKVVFGPATFINEAVRQLGEGVTERLATEGGQEQLLELAEEYELTGLPSISDPDFVSRLVFDDTRPAGTPKRRFSSLFPTRDAGRGRAALVTVRLEPDLTDAQRNDAIAQIRAATRMDRWQLVNGGSYSVAGAPVVVSDLTGAITDSIVALLVAALVLMALTLALVFSSRLRLLPLAVALVASAVTFGGLSLAGASLTMASIAVLPVLIGLAVDYAIQLQSRIAEERRGGLGAGPAARRAALLGAPTVATAAAATAAGFAVLALSPVPMVRGFGLLLVVGIVVAFACALAAGTAALVHADRRRAPGRVARAGLRAMPHLRGARELVLDNRLSRAVGQRTSRGARAALALAVRRPGRVLAVAAAVAVAGWALDTQSTVESDIQKLVPQELEAVQDLQTLQRVTGVGGDVNVLVRADDVTRPEIVTWMAGFQERALERFGYSDRRGCGQADLCPALSLPDLFPTAESRVDAQRIDALLTAVPEYFSQSLITTDRRTATLSFGIRLMALDEQKEILDELDGLLTEGRPDGVRAELAGLPVLAAEANARVSSHPRRVLTLVVGLLAVALVLLLAFRRADRALIPLVPIVLATGWSAAVLFALRIPLNPMTVTLGALVIAISTEFSVLLAERYRQERAAGHRPAEALERTYRSTGAAVLASGATAIAGFAVLMVSDIPMLRDFGFVTVVDLSVSLLGVLLVLPAVLLLAERGRSSGRLALRRGSAGGVLRRRGRPRPKAVA